MTGDDANGPRRTDERILDAAIAVLAREGAAGARMRAVAREAGLAIGLANYHFKNKTELISAALRRIGERDLELVAAPDRVDPRQALRSSLRNALDNTFLTAEYLSLRLQLWSLAGVDERFAEINRSAQQRYLPPTFPTRARSANHRPRESSWRSTSPTRLLSAPVSPA